MSRRYSRVDDDDDDRRRVGLYWGACCSSVVIALIVTAVVLALVNNETAPLATRYGFVTAGLYAADFGGFTGANAICEAEAANSTIDAIANSTRHWRAILGTYDEPGAKRSLVEVTEEGIPMFGRFSELDGPIYLPSGVIVAHNWTQLISESSTTDILEYPFIENQDGLNVTMEMRVWTGGIAATTGAGRNCGLWNETTGNGNYGLATSIDNEWRRPDSGGVAAACSTPLRIYCLMDTKR